LLLVFTTLALCPAVVRAQGKSGAAQSAVMSTPTPSADTTSSSLGQANEQSALELVTLVLKLNDSQQEQLHAAFDAALKEATPIADEMEHARNALFAAARSGKSEEEIRRLADEQGQLTSRMLFLQAQTFAKLWGLLDSRQKGLADDFVYSNIRLFLPASPQ
jgi:Spy/CpxP family protein refolding chaperone